MSKRENRPAWFKMFLSHKPMIDSVSDETAGKALKALFRYFDTGELPELDPLAKLVFDSMRPYVDESFSDFEEKQRNMVYARWKGQNPNGTKEEFEKYYSEKRHADIV